MTDVRKAVTATDPSYKKHQSRPSTSSRKTTPQAIPKLGKNPRDREKELDDERWWDEERQSFPEYWYVSLSVSSTPCSLGCVSQLAIFPSCWSLLVSGSLPFTNHFHFHPPASSPDMQVIGVTPIFF